MPSAVSENPELGSRASDDLDNLFNYDDAVEDFLQDLPINKSQSNNVSALQDPAKNIDEEITVKKKRKPVPKLDEARLLSQAGIPKLRKITKSRLKFRGKGHEFSDMSRLLNTYQLWLDDLYPREKFRDALGRVEKLGHSKRMQVTRRAWLDDTKPHQREASPERVEDVMMSGALPKTGNVDQKNGIDESEAALFGDLTEEDRAANGPKTNAPTNDAPEDDELDALLAGSGTTATARNNESLQRRRGPFEEDDMDEDELDALIAENVEDRPSNPSNVTAPSHRRPGPFEDDSVEDDLDALLAEQSAAPRKDSTKMISGRNPPEDDFADEEDALASMGGMW